MKNIMNTISTSIFATCLLAPSINQASSANTPRPNILFLFADDMRSSTIRALGNNEIITHITIKELICNQSKVFFDELTSNFFLTFALQLFFVFTK